MRQVYCIYIQYIDPPFPQAFPPEDVAVPTPHLLDRVRHKIRLVHSTIHTAQADVEWAPRYAHFRCLRHSETLGAEAIVAFLTHPAGEGNVAAAMEKPANSAPLVL